MMSLARTSSGDIVKRQYAFKLKAHIDSYSSLVGIQMLALLFSFGGVGSMGSYGDGLNLEVKYYSSDLVLVFTAIWAFVTATTLTTRPYRNHDFTFVSNRLTSSLSNILFLASISLAGALTAMLAGNLLKVFVFIFADGPIYNQGTGLADLAAGTVIALFYLFLVTSAGYLIGSLVQVSKLFVILIPVVFFGSLFLDAVANREPIVNNVFQFYIMESSLLLLMVKTLITSAALLAAAVAILNRLEVRR
ncbi:hypothetical protein WQ57_19830 [Mesobacillus campisalis]|uniref:Uncharacterized protein n=1 Tax=Mesobacillus campisalis TaxID=1408103 RepID=A0A0M2STP1_9BACI|nr:hypothetical protein [Mesobacillus campisalis]KKK36337.1 hypothetical protein WQ57_19830 [Mesobacillus campisalis]